MGSIHRSGVLRKSSNDGSARVIIIAILGILIGILIGISLSNVLLIKLDLSPSFPSSIDDGLINGHETGRSVHDLVAAASLVETKSSHVPGPYDGPKIHVKTNPRGAELLPPGIVVSETDFYLRRLWGHPNEDLKTRSKYLVTFTVGFDQRDNINAAMRKFSDDFTVLLFHYDGRTSEWDEFEWSRHAIHVSALRQTKWWYAKRFLHPDVVAAYDYIFIWDEDLGVEHFNAEKYLESVKKYGLEISQPAIEVDPDKRVQWNMTKRRGDTEVHKEAADPDWCRDPHAPPCAAFVEIMAPVFSRDAWRCVWHMIQNDLVHGWGLDFALRRCVEPAHEKIGVVDSQWVIHQAVPSLGNQGQAEKGKASWEGVKKRCFSEWRQFQTRLADADRAYFQRLGEGS